MAGTRKPVDWERVEIEYRAGVMSLPELAAAHNISTGRICQVAKERGWPRDLKAKILARAEAKLNAFNLNGILNDAKQTVEDVVDARSNDVVAIRLSHRTGIHRTKSIVDKLLETLEGFETTEDNIREHAMVLKQLADSQKTVVSMEREAYGLDDTPEVQPPPSHIDPMEGARRIAFILQRATLMIEGQQ